MKENMLDIALKQTIPTPDEQDTIEAIMEHYKPTTWGGVLWAASMIYQAGKIAGIRQERSRRKKGRR